ncbi:MAG: LacI family transcriptional regulator [Pedobacter sp.]|nr:MAG: LacI family transcriptional regulator [Pedobacter sp.]
MKKVSLKDIAQIAGVVPSTVSMVLNGKAKENRISDAVAEKIMAIAKEVGYSPNQVAVSLRTGSSKIIGLIVEDISNIFYATIASVIEDELKSEGYRIVYCSTKNDPVNGVELINMLSQRQVDGYIITPVEGMEDSLRNLKNQQKPVILIDRFPPGLDISHVLVNDEKGIIDGVNHLHERGYKNIGLITVDLGQVHMNYREKAFKKYHADNGHPLKEELVLKIPYDLEVEGMIAMVCDFLSRSEELDALFFTTNYLCIIGLQALKRLNKNIPGDIAVLCFDDSDVFELYPPGISSIRQPVEEIGKRAVSLLMDCLDSPGNAITVEHVLLPATLIQRGST